MVTFATKLEFRLTPVDEAERLTTFNLVVLIDDNAVWPVRGEADASIEVQIDDLLAYLTEFWTPLMLRQVYPAGVNPRRPSDLRSEIDARWSELPPAMIEREEDVVSSFEEAHNMATAFGGYSDLPSLWLLRAGSEFIVEAAEHVNLLPFQTVRTELERLGDFMSQRLSSGGARWQDAISAWASRGTSDGAGLLAWSAGINRELAQNFIADGILRAPDNFNDAANDNDELRIAARMAGALPADQIRSIIKLARQFGKREALPLKQTSTDCLAFVVQKYSRSKPHVQGEAVARFLRESLRLQADIWIDVFRLAREMGVTIRTSAEEPESLLGLAIWGSHHGPGVFLNEGSTAQLSEHGPINMEERSVSRVTLAHELCHLLLDGDHALSAVEILQARTPRSIEQRAKSFAGEFLLPKAVSAEAWVKAKRPTGRAAVEQLVVELARAFGVTRKVAAWKLEHGAQMYLADLSAILDTIEPYR